MNIRSACKCCLKEAGTVRGCYLAGSERRTMREVRLPRVWSAAWMHNRARNSRGDNSWRKHLKGCETNDWSKNKSERLLRPLFIGNTISNCHQRSGWIALLIQLVEFKEYQEASICTERYRDGAGVSFDWFPLIFEKRTRRKIALCWEGWTRVPSTSDHVRGQYLGASIFPFFPFFAKSSFDSFPVSVEAADHGSIKWAFYDVRTHSPYDGQRECPFEVASFAKSDLDLPSVTLFTMPRLVS